MSVNAVKFSILNHASWAPGISGEKTWAAWAQTPFALKGSEVPTLEAMPAMLRRRASFLGKMALGVAFQCLAGRRDVPSVFCSRHGEVSRAVDLLTELAEDGMVSPTGFGMAVHNANAGLFSIARRDQANHIALAAGTSTVEHAVIEACSLMADGAAMVLLVMYEANLPPLFEQFRDCDEQSYAWAWLMVPAQENAISLSWTACTELSEEVKFTRDMMPAGLAVLRFQLSDQACLERKDGQKIWRWDKHA